MTGQGIQETWFVEPAIGNQTFIALTLEGPDVLPGCDF